MDKNYDISFLDENKINEILENSKAKSKDKEEIRNITFSCRSCCSFKY